MQKIDLADIKLLFFIYFQRKHIIKKKKKKSFVENHQMKKFQNVILFASI